MISIMRQTSIVVLLLTIHSLAHAKSCLNVYNWSGYLSQDILNQFTSETGICVNYTTYDSNEMMYTKISMNPSSNYDVIMPSSYFLKRMQSLLQPIDAKRIPNLHHVDHWFIKHTPKPLIGIPYLWSCVGIVVNDRYINPSSMTHWKDLWHPRFKNQLLMINDARDVMNIGLLAIGTSPNTQKLTSIQEAYQKLQSLMPNIKLFSEESSRSLYIDEDVIAGIAWNGDALEAKRENPHVHFIYPQDGWVMSIDHWAILKNAPHLNEAYAFINFMLNPAIAAKVSLATGYPTVESNAFKYLPLSYRKDPTFNPSFKNAFVQEDAGDEANRYFQHVFTRLKMG